MGRNYLRRRPFVLLVARESTAVLLAVWLEVMPRLTWSFYRGSTRLTSRNSAARTPSPEGMVCFLLGCSFSFEEALDRAGLPLRHVEEGKNVPMFQTDRDCHPVGVFQGPLVASMRPMAEDQARRAAKVTRRYPRVHGSPVHIGSPVSIGIKDISKPQFGDAVTVHPGVECVELWRWKATVVYSTVCGGAKI
ncbi:unnamed protein product [Discosporangium mesarthrocarpum]